MPETSETRKKPLAPLRKRPKCASHMRPFLTRQSHRRFIAMVSCDRQGCHEEATFHCADGNPELRTMLNQRL